MADTPTGPSPGKPSGPVILELDVMRLPEAPSPAAAPQPSETGEPAAARALSLAGRRRWGLGRWLLAALGGLILLWMGVQIEGFVTGLLASNSVLGWVALGLVSLVAVLLLLLAAREAAALARLSKVEALRDAADEALETGSAAAGDRALIALAQLYDSRPDMEWALARLTAARPDTPDAEARLAIAERTLLTPLDQQAEDVIRRSTREVAAATALIPLALIDVLAALSVNLRMIREIAEIYGGRAGWLGSWRLMRAVAGHLITTGAVAVADDMLGPLLGGGVLAKVSRRFGEGALNGALTARVGVAAAEICRPLSYRVLDKPSASGLVLSALSSWRASPEKEASKAD